MPTTSALTPMFAAIIAALGSGVDLADHLNALLEDHSEEPWCWQSNPAARDYGHIWRVADIGGLEEGSTVVPLPLTEYQLLVLAEALPTGLRLFEFVWLNDEKTRLSVRYTGDVPYLLDPNDIPVADPGSVDWPTDGGVSLLVGKDVDFHDSGDDLCEAIFHAE